MADALHLPQGGTREDIYKAILPQIAAVTGSVDDAIANMANIAAILKQAFNFHWVGFYRTTAPQTLTLGPFQGPLACVIIPFARGVCGATATRKETVIVPDVEKFPGHIACSSLSRSEIVVPLVINGETQLLLDVDSDQVDDFSTMDQYYLEQIMGLLKRHY
ncbi:MAG: GAF domain-containing protein [Alphaproteobacteria bacterium]|nr:GAF domain-containing protein [Alphaproteobacteria bacterium]MBV8548539.1 GAF domain-containing protein [Alphaproteobacteria bacterium]